MSRAATLVGLAVLLSASAAGAQRLPFTWDVPKVLETVEVPGVMQAQGVPVKLRSVKSAEKPEVILQHMVDRFEQWDFYIPDKRTQWLKEPQLTALDTERLISYTFILQSNPDGSTTVVMGEANLAQTRPAQSPIAPLFPGAKDVVSSDVEVARMVSYRLTVSKETPDVEGFYRKQLAQAGYSETEPNTYRKGTEELVVTVGPPKEGQLSVMVTRRTSTEGSHSPDPHAD
jgi:hypothetical protein